MCHMLIFVKVKITIFEHFSNILFELLKILLCTLTIKDRGLHFFTRDRDIISYSPISTLREISKGRQKSPTGIMVTSKNISMRNCSKSCSAPPFPKHCSLFKLSVPNGTLLPQISNHVNFTQLTLGQITQIWILNITPIIKLKSNERIWEILIKWTNCQLIKK